jgi:hypothetical protein
MTAFDRERRRVERLLAEGQMTKREAERRMNAINRAERRLEVFEERTAQRERHLATARLRYRLKASQEIFWC